TLANNVIANLKSGVGIQFSGDANSPNAQGQPVPVAAVPFGRLVNNTIYGGDKPSGTGILVSNNAAPTLLNNIVSNTTTGISVDASSLLLTSDNKPRTILLSNLYSNNTLNTNVSGGGGSAIFLQATDPLFVDPA